MLRTQFGAYSVFCPQESFDQGSRTDPMFENIWPDTDDLPGFQSFMEEFYDLYHNVHLVLLGALERGLGLPESRLQSLCSQNQTELRLTHYPAVDVKDLKDGSRTRIARHTDFGSLTLLFQDSTGGLEVEDQTREGIFLPIESSCKSEMIVNVGDTLQNWTNQILRSANHQVTIPKSLKEKDQGVIEPRYSVAFFGKANRDVSLRCLEEFRSLRPPVNDEDLTTWEYNSRMVERTYPLSAATAVA